MPSSKRVDVKEGGGSERLKGEKEEERARRGETGVCRMPLPLTAGDPVFRTTNIASWLSSSIGTRSVCEDVDSNENKGWLWPSIGKDKREGDL